MTDTVADAGKYYDALRELQLRQLEAYLVRVVAEHGTDILTHSGVAKIVETVALDRGISQDEVIQTALETD